MTTGKDYGLPDEYADWVLKKLEDGVDGAQSSFIRVTFERLDGIPGDRRAQLVMWAYLFPPKPRPTLPEVGPGAVISYRRKGHIPGGKNRARAIKNAEGWWTVYHEGLHGAPVYKAVASTYFSHKKFVWTADEWADRWFDEDLLASVDDDGFTVELDGLE